MKKLSERIEETLNFLSVNDTIFYDKPGNTPEGILEFSRKKFSYLLEFFGQNGLDIPEKVSPCLDLQFCLNQLSQQELEDRIEILVRSLKRYTKLDTSANLQK